MTDFAAARRMMVDGQVRTADVTDRRLIDAMSQIPRERFVPPEQAALAYLDIDLPVGKSARGCRMLKPMVLAKLIQAAEIEGTDHVLDVGCATGYSSAVIAQLAGNVVGLEQDASAATKAAELLRDMRNVKVATGPLAEGRASAAPYDAILVNGSCEIAPRALLHQLKDGGRLVCVSGQGPIGKATLWRRGGATFGERVLFDAAAPVLAGFIKPRAFAF